MSESKVPAFNLTAKRGVPRLLSIEHVGDLVSDFTGYKATLVVENCGGEVVFSETTNCTSVPGSLHVASASFVIPKEAIAKLEFGKNNFYHVLFENASGTYRDIFLHGYVETYITSGGS